MVAGRLRTVRRRESSTSIAEMHANRACVDASGDDVRLSVLIEIADGDRSDAPANR
jgi:hypothetical protein